METKRPPVRPRTPIKCAGPYVGAGDPKVTAEDWDKVGKDMYDAGYNQFSVFLALNTPLRFLPVNADLSLNKKWVESNYNFQERMAFWRHNVQMKIFDQYHEGEKNDPFASLTTEQLYSSWDGSKYAHTKWDEPLPRRYTNFRPTSKIGIAIKFYVKAVVANSKKVKELKLPNGKPKYPDFRVVLVWANETMALFKDSNHPVKTRGDREEMLAWVTDLYEQAGFVKGKDLFVQVDYLAFRPDIRTIDYKIMANVSKDLTRRGMRLEIHGIKTVADIQKYIKAGVDPKSTLFSTDGDLKYTAEGQKLLDSPYHVDLKVDAKPGQPFFPTDFMQFWNHYFPPYGAHKQ